MAGKHNGVKAHINQSHPLAMFVHCAVHYFNLVVSKSCSIQSIRNRLGTVEKAHNYFVHLNGNTYYHNVLIRLNKKFMQNYYDVAVQLVKLYDFNLFEIL